MVHGSIQRYIFIVHLQERENGPHHSAHIRRHLEKILWDSLITHFPKDMGEMCFLILSSPPEILASSKPGKKKEAARHSMSNHRFYKIYTRPLKGWVKKHNCHHKLWWRHDPSRLCSFEHSYKETAEMGCCSHAPSVEEENDLSFQFWWNFEIRLLPGRFPNLPPLRFNHEKGQGPLVPLQGL